MVESIDVQAVAFVLAVFALAGAVKGIIGLGLPVLAVALLVLVLDHVAAVGLILLPAATTNVWQALNGGRFRAIVREAWLFLILSAATVWLGTLLLSTDRNGYLLKLLGGLLILYAAFTSVSPKFRLSEQAKGWLGPVAGITSGLFTGMTGVAVMPGVAYLHALGFEQVALVQALGIYFVSSTVGLAISLHSLDLLNGHSLAMSALCTVPALIGFWAGSRLRSRMDPSAFRALFLGGLSLVGMYLLAR